MRRSMLAGTLAVALAGAVAAVPATAAESAPPPTARSAGLLDGLGGSLGGTLGGVLGSLLGTSGQQQQLEQLLQLLQGGTAPTGDALAPLTTLLDQIAGTAGLPVGTQSLLQQISGLLGSAPDGQPLSPIALTQVSTLLRDLGSTAGVPASAASLLSQLADVLDGNGNLDGLPVAALSLSPQLLDDLNALLAKLQQGREPTGTLLEPVTGLLREVAGTDGLPSDAATLLNTLGDTLERTTGALDPLLTSQISTALSLISGTPGLSSETRTTIERITTILQQAAAGRGASGAHAATKADRAVVVRVRLNGARTVIAARVACPRSAPATCATVVRAGFAGRTAARGKRVRIGAGRSKVVRLRMLPAPRTASTTRGGTLRVAVSTTFGNGWFTAAKSVRVKAGAAR